MPVKSNVQYSSTNIGSVQTLWETGLVTELQSERLDARYRPHGTYRIFWHLSDTDASIRDNVAFHKAIREGDKIKLKIYGHEPFRIEDEEFTYDYLVHEEWLHSLDGANEFRTHGLNHFSKISLAIEWGTRTTVIWGEQVGVGNGVYVAFNSTRFGRLDNRWFIQDILGVAIDGHPFGKGRESIGITHRDGMILFGATGMSLNPDAPGDPVNYVVQAIFGDHDFSGFDLLYPGDYNFQFSSAPADGAIVTVDYVVRPFFLGNLNVKLVKTPD